MNVRTHQRLHGIYLCQARAARLRFCTARGLFAPTCGSYRPNRAPETWRRSPRHSLPPSPYLQDGYARSAVINDERRQCSGPACLRIDCDTAVTCALAVSRLAPGWKNTLTTAWGFKVVDSMCSMLSTVVVNTRSKTLAIQPSTSCPSDRDDGNVDVWKDVGRSAKDHDRAQNQNQKSQNNKGVRTI
jgi:hypothetical protein